jgi:hypothetical protein
MDNEKVENDTTGALKLSTVSLWEVNRVSHLNISA